MAQAGAAQLGRQPAGGAAPAAPQPCRRALAGAVARACQPASQRRVARSRRFIAYDMMR